MSDDYGYGLWWLVVMNTAVFVIFAFAFIRPRTRTDWRALGGFTAFIVAMSTEMYGFPLTIYLLSGWLVSSILIAAGFILLYRSWHVLYAAQRTQTLALTGPYARVRHPQFLAFLIIMAFLPRRRLPSAAGGRGT